MAMMCITFNDLSDYMKSIGKCINDQLAISFTYMQYTCQKYNTKRVSMDM